MKSAIGKIDAVGSKKYIEESKKGNAARKDLLNHILACAKKCYKNAEKLFPNGVLFSSQGDCIYLIVSSLEEAIDSTIRFQTEWEVEKNYCPDIRAIIAFSDIVEIDLLGRIELISRGFEEISILEKGHIEDKYCLLRMLQAQLKMGNIVFRE